MEDARCPSGAGGRSARGGHDGLAEADAAVVARDPGMGEHGEAITLKQPDAFVQQQKILEHSA